MEYRREIDGLRAVAVLSVIFFHSQVALFPGGYLGVDIFFVISGYLITGIIIDELEQGSFSITNFYERRARRILPALFLMMVVTIPFAWTLLTPSELVSFSKSIAAVPLFLSNFFFLKDGEYFETAAELKPLIHTWSLSVEEQYYLFFPLLLLLCWRSGRRAVVAMIAVLAVLSLALSQLEVARLPLHNFFLLPTRAWELAVGSLAYFADRRKPQVKLDARWRQLMSLSGCVLVVASIVGFDKDTPSPSVYTLLPTLGTALLLLYARPDTVLGKLLGNRFLVSVGLVSYSAYLWHQPILAYSRYYFQTPSAALTSALIVSSLAAGALSWRFVERPFRDPRRVHRKTIFALALGVSAVFVAFGGFSSWLLDKTLRSGLVETKISANLASSDYVYTSNVDERLFIKARIGAESLRPDTIVLGSSRIMQVGDHNYHGKLLNLSVSGASLEDVIALADMATRKFQPRTLLVGVDPWLFNARSGQVRWKSIEAEYQVGLARIGSAAAKTNIGVHEDRLDSHLSTLLAEIYLRVNARSYVAFDDLPQARDKIRRDGSRIYNIAYATKSEREIRAGLDSLLDYSMSDYEYSEYAEQRFSEFVDFYSGEYELVLVLTPYHPELYERMLQQRPVFLQLESEIKKFANRHRIRIVGSYDPRSVGCGPSDFYDGMHPKDDCMGKVLRQLRDPGGAGG